jgi:DNA-binding transcriptional LysR family regulator
MCLNNLRGPRWYEVINLKHLYYYYIFSQEMHMGKAAKRLFITVPALSNQLKDLEDSLGFKLYTREKGKNELTEKGRIVAEYTSKIFSPYEELRSEVKRKSGKGTFV